MAPDAKIPHHGIGTDILRRSPFTVRRWLKDGIFPHAVCVKDGWLIPESDLRRLPPLP